MSSIAPRAVLVTRETDYDSLLAQNATRDQAKFFLKSRGQSLKRVDQRHEQVHTAMHRVRSAVPHDWRVATVQRGDLDRFLFGPEDVVIAVGQDGLVANLAKYLQGQPVLGINPEPDINPGVLVPLPPEAVSDLLVPATQGRVALQNRTMAEATLDDGQTLMALNEIFIGHRSHQSARYSLTHGDEAEEQSSSGVIVATGTGATGWAKSIMLSRQVTMELDPSRPELGYFVREPWPSAATGAALSIGTLRDTERIEILSQMRSGGVIFADGIEKDHLSFDWGRRATIGVASRQLSLVTG